MVRIHQKTSTCWLVPLLIILSQNAHADEIQRGKLLAQSRCANCHSIEKVGPSPFRKAPPFRELHHRYPLEALEESLAEGIVTGHPQMPIFMFSPRQIGELIAYLKTLK